MAAAAAGESTGRRILDYLNDGEELGLAEPASTPRASAAVAAARSLLPRFRWARLSRLGRNCGGGKGRPPVVEMEEEEEEIAGEKGELKPSMGASEPTAAADGGDGEARPPNPDIGVGLSLVFLLAKTSAEFRKMAEVRAEMETLMEEFKSGQACLSSVDDGDGEVSGARRDPEYSAASSCLTTDWTEPRIASARLEDHAGADAAMSFEKSSDGGCCSGSGKMELLEEELHAELERLHANYGAPDTPPGERGTGTAAEWSDDDGDCRQGSDGGEFEEDDMEDEHEGDEYEDEDDGGGVEEEERNGVSAVALERRLHELLHQRHQERIEELEAALGRAERKIAEKEMEAAMWKDTARMALRRHDDDDELQ